MSNIVHDFNENYANENYTHVFMDKAPQYVESNGLNSRMFVSVSGIGSTYCHHNEPRTGTTNSASQTPAQRAHATNLGT